MLTMQEAILRLHAYWAGQGCLLAQPFNTEVGAGTLNPATLLRVLGPEPWKVAYVEPSVRPDDARYGENPNRMQTHTQYQVVLKPAPEDVQDLYLGSLRALGVDTGRHDVRFVEDNWESPAVGAWGLGWEVWLDGLEITQFTYFQQAGGMVLKPPSVEITYGLERILMALQGVAHFKDIAFTEAIPFGELAGPAERQMSAYYLDEADVGVNRALFELYEREARSLLARRLPLPAYTYVLKCSHTFNVLDARGAIGTSERASAFARMRSLANQVAQQWLQEREALGYPLGAPPEPASPPLPAAVPAPATEAAAPFVLEVGCEELPPGDLEALLEQLRARVPALLAELRLAHGEVRVAGTPRRLAVLVDALACRQPDRARTVRGPSAAAAFDAAGRPTRAAEGFARAQGVAVEDLAVRQEPDGTAYVTAVRQEPGRPAGEVLAEALPRLLASLEVPRAMRWTARPVAFSRPVRWLVALHGDRVVPLAFAGVPAGRHTRGLRARHPEPVRLGGAGEYLPALERLGVVLDPERRRQAIWEGARALAAQVGGCIPEQARAGLLAEVGDLVESPTPLLGGFDPRFLALPSGVLATVMRKHQRYFPVETPAGELAPHFVVVANGPVDPEAVRAGNEAVLRARFADAEFFWRQDTARPLADLREGLARLVVHERLGSMLDHAERTRRLAGELAAWLGLDAEARQVLDRAAVLAKADLAAQMVIEFPSLAGSMGREYALRGGEPPAVADAIEQHYWPRHAGDRLPASAPAAALGLADRLVSLVGLFAVGVRPRGSADPYGLRRLAAGLVQVLVDRGLRLDLRRAVGAAAALQPVEVPAATRDAVLEFAARRLEQLLLDRGHRPDRVAAVLGARAADPALAAATLQELDRAAGGERFQRVLEAVLRAVRITDRAAAVPPLAPERLREPAEQHLWQVVAKAQAHLRPDASLEAFLDAADPLPDAVARFFDEVLVMAEDPEVRGRRLALLRAVAALAEPILDPRALR